MPAWIESHTTMRNHKKLIALCNALQISRAAAIGHLHMLWWWAIENRETGDLTGLFDKDIAVACDWDENPKVLIDALHLTGWLKDYQISDWDDYSYRLLGMRQANRERQRRHRAVTRDVTGYVPPATEQNLTKHKDIVPYSEFVEVWNSKTKTPIKNLSEKRKAKLRKLFGLAHFIENWRAAVDGVAGSAFLSGENERGWKADFDWFVNNDNNYVKVLEGKYVGKTTQEFKAIRL